MNASQIWTTHVLLDVLVLEIVRVLPHVDSNDREVRQERILVTASNQLQTLGGRVQTLEPRKLIESQGAM